MLKRQLGELMKAGKKEEAQKVEHQLRTLVEHMKKLSAERGEACPPQAPADQMRRRLAEIRQRAAVLRREGKQEGVAQLEREGHAILEKLKQLEAQRRPHPPGQRNLQQRQQLLGEATRSLHEAAGKLQAAGYPEAAGELREMATRIGHEARKQAQGAELHKVISELRAEVARLRQDVDRLKRASQERRE